MESPVEESTARHVCIVNPANGHKHTHTFILLHGRDSNCDKFSSEFFESEISEDLAELLARREGVYPDTAPHPRTLQALFLGFKWVFPNALPIFSERFGTPLNQWFDIWSVESPSERLEIQETGLRQNASFIAKVIADESRLVSRDRLYLGGISQGFTTAVTAYLAGGQQLGGLIGFSSWAHPALAQYGLLSVGEERLPVSGFSLTDGMKATSVFLGHSIDDDVVPIQNGRVLRDALRNIGQSNIEWHEYEHGGHWITEPKGVDDLVRFLRRTMD
ncbi:phospholipase/carboxylesterase [Colletotrichum higginsianum]|nr:phospholipase/carboxylesterase [Colletotrichum higginsianum]